MLGSGHGWAVVDMKGASGSEKLEGVESGEGRMMEGWETDERDVAALAAVDFTDPVLVLVHMDSSCSPCAT